MSIIDKEGYRHGVGIVLANEDGKVLLARRWGSGDQWQFPQGGIQAAESLEQSMFRELREEVGLRPEHVEILARTERRFTYRLPEASVIVNENSVEDEYIGQRLVFFLLRLTADSSAINVFADENPEFDSWAWVSYWYPVSAIVQFKRDMYRAALTELSPGLHAGDH